MKKTSKYNWTMVAFLSMCPIIGIFGTLIYVLNYGISYFEPVLLLVFWFLSGIGITMGYHRLFAHKSYRSNVILEWILMVFGSLALENTILKWVSDHRKHHSLSDTEHDPYSITKGFWHAHIGWIIKKSNNESSKIKGVKDLEKKSAIIFQNKYYLLIAFVFGFLLPLYIGYLFGRPIGGLLWGTFLRITIVHHATFFINSLCHYFGKRPYDLFSSARDSWFVSLFTFGEGYHNYHHKFPSDFRNGVSWFAFDPSKWIISILSFFKVTTNLIRTQESLIFKSKFDTSFHLLKSKLETMGSFYQDNYKSKIDDLFEKSNQILLSWQEYEKKNNFQSSNFYRSQAKELFKNLKILNKQLI
tara:strand:+ start:70 stop:1143 length:1074 start_codon:yes stop_codon:yes gene_type:complete